MLSQEDLNGNMGTVGEHWRLLNLSDNNLKQAYFDTVVYQIDKDGPGGS
jgi:hypothetical protein